MLMNAACVNVLCDRQGNVGEAAYYACAIPLMIRRWRQQFATPELWFGFVQIAGWMYTHAWWAGGSLQAGDLRQAQLAALALPNVGMSTTIDTGDWYNIHPPVRPRTRHLSCMR